MNTTPKSVIRPKKLILKTQRKYGPLQSIGIMDALKKYGVSALDESIESELHPDLTRMGHTNLTGGRKDYQGGGLWCLQDDSVVIIFRSGRYGAENEVQKKAVIAYFQFVGYQYVDVREQSV